MPMNEVIYEKRKELGLTQEQIAAYLGVSAPAVNKWEKGNTYPDITLLPALARLLKVDLNTLLCFQDGPSQQEIYYFSNEAAKLIRSDGIDAGFQEMKQKIREYPRCAALIHTFALVLDGALIMSELTAEEKEPYEKELLDWYRRVAESDDEKQKTNAAYMLASRYMRRREFENAQKMIDLLPEHNILDKRTLQAELCLQEGKEESLSEAANLTQRKLMTLAMEISSTLNRMVRIELASGNAEKAERIAELAANAADLLELGDYFAAIFPLDIASARKDIQKSVLLIERMLSSVPDLWKMQDSLLYGRIAEFTDNKASAANILPPLLTQLEQAPEFDFLRGSEEFEKIVEKYKKKL